uniref:Uncharacterized protein n=1 Tax=Anguilla anguilla TaxID=7936 RepID=A0A0E9QSV4_ANGAN
MFWLKCFPLHSLMRIFNAVCTHTVPYQPFCSS